MVRLRDSWRFSLSSAPTVGNPFRPLQPETVLSWQPCDDPMPGDKLACDAIETVIVPRARDLGSFEVRRALPSDKRQMVGPFIFFDQMGPSEFRGSSGAVEG